MASRINAVAMFWWYNFDFQNCVFPEDGITLDVISLLVKVKLYIFFSNNDSYKEGKHFFSLDDKIIKWKTKGKQSIVCIWHIWKTDFPVAKNKPEKKFLDKTIFYFFPGAGILYSHTHKYLTGQKNNPSYSLEALITS